MEEKTKKLREGVFIVYGQDIEAKDSISSVLRALDIKITEFNQAVNNFEGDPNPFIGQVLQDSFEKAQALIVIFSPDEEVFLKEKFCKTEKEKSKREQPRPNVILEAGMALSKFPEKTIIVSMLEETHFLSDLAGRHVIKWNNGASPRNQLKERLLKAGCIPDASGNDWLEAGYLKRFDKNEKKLLT